MIFTSGHFLPALTRLREVSLTLAVIELGFEGYLRSRSPGVHGKPPSSPGFPMSPILLFFSFKIGKKQRTWNCTSQAQLIPPTVHLHSAPPGAQRPVPANPINILPTSRGRREGGSSSFFISELLPQLPEATSCNIENGNPQSKWC